MKRSVIIVVSLAAVGGGVAAIVAASTGGTPRVTPPNPVVGKPLKPLTVYERPRRLARTPRPNERAIPVLTGTNALSTVVKRKPVLSLHVNYARVIPAGQGWRIAFDAQESDAFNDRTTFPNTFVVLIDGKATNLIFSRSDGVNYQIGLKGEFPTLSVAFAVARSLTTSVTVARCSQVQIEQYKCA